VGGVHEVDRPAAQTGPLQPRLQLALEEGGPVAGVFGDRLLGRDGDGPGPTPAEPEPILEEVADLGQASADAGPPLDDGAGLVCGADRVGFEVLVRGDSMFDQGGPGLRLPAATEASRAPFEILVEVALDGASGDVGVGGDPVMARAEALEPEDLDLAPDAGFGVMVAVMGQGLPVASVKMMWRMTCPARSVSESLLARSLCLCSDDYNLCQIQPSRV
jgi:hypothetical protein